MGSHISACIYNWRHQSPILRLICDYKTDLVRDQSYNVRILRVVRDLVRDSINSFTIFCSFSMGYFHLLYPVCCVYFLSCRVTGNF